jgi:hypothetical protein
LIESTQQDVVSLGPITGPQYGIVTVVVTKHPGDIRYLIVAVQGPGPGLVAVTTPVVLIVPHDGVRLLHTPAGVASARVVVVEGQAIIVAPVIGAGRMFVTDALPDIVLVHPVVLSVAVIV